MPIERFFVTTLKYAVVEMNLLIHLKGMGCQNITWIHLPQGNVR
jgi:hypothetical protein